MNGCQWVFDTLQICWLHHHTEFVFIIISFWLLSVLLKAKNYVNKHCFWREMRLHGDCTHGIWKCVFGLEMKCLLNLDFNELISNHGVHSISQKMSYTWLHKLLVLAKIINLIFMRILSAFASLHGYKITQMLLRECDSA